MGIYHKEDLPVFAVTTGSFWPAGSGESIRRLQELDLTHIELTIQQDEFYLDLHRKLCMPHLTELRRSVESGKIQIHAVHAPHMAAEHGFSLRTRAEYLAQTIETCCLLGGRIVDVHPFHLFKSYEDSLAYLGDEDVSVWDVLLPDVAVRLEQAKQAGIVVSLENVKLWLDDETEYFNSPAAIKRFLCDVDHPQLGFTLDIVHAQLSDCLEGYFELLPEAVTNLHLADLSAVGQRSAPGKGIMEWEKIVPIMKNFPNLKQYTLELPTLPPEEVLRSARYLCHLWEGGSR